MYELFVLACLIGSPNMCVTLKDLYSPHQTHDKCLARAYEIARGMPVHMPMYFPKSYKCLDMKTEGNKIKTKWHTKKEKQHYSRNMD